MNRVLLADFGSTRIKLLLWDRCTGLVDREERPGAVPIRSDGGRFETSPEFYWSRTPSGSAQKCMAFSWPIDTVPRSLHI